MIKRLALVLYLFPIWAGAAQPDVPALVVTGHGEVRVAPDMAVLRFGTVAEARQAAEAQKEAGRVMARAVTALGQAGIPSERIATEAIRLNPVYSRSSVGASRISGYRATHSLRVELHRLERVGEIIDAVTGAGVNQLQSLEFGLQDGSAAERDALRRAAADGRAKAQALAGSLGVKLSQLTRASEGVATSRPPVPMLEMARVDAVSAVQPGELSVEGTVTLEFAVTGEQQ